MQVIQVEMCGPQLAVGIDCTSIFKFVIAPLLPARRENSLLTIGAPVLVVNVSVLNAALGIFGVSLPCGTERRTGNENSASWVV
jgi:hypothetical protein